MLHLIAHDEHEIVWLLDCASAFGIRNKSGYDAYQTSNIWMTVWHRKADDKLRGEQNCKLKNPHIKFETSTVSLIHFLFPLRDVSLLFRSLSLFLSFFFHQYRTYIHSTHNTIIHYYYGNFAILNHFFRSTDFMQFPIHYYLFAFTFKMLCNFNRTFSRRFFVYHSNRTFIALKTS